MSQKYHPDANFSIRDEERFSYEVFPWNRDILIFPNVRYGFQASVSWIKKRHTNFDVAAVVPFVELDDPDKNLSGNGFFSKEVGGMLLASWNFTLEDLPSHSRVGSCEQWFWRTQVDI